MSLYDYCNILVLYKEDITDELREFIKPLVEEWKDLFPSLKGGRRITAFVKLNRIHELPGYEKLSDESKRQHLDHCKRMEEEDTLELIEHM